MFRYILRVTLSLLAVVISSTSLANRSALSREEEELVMLESLGPIDENAILAYKANLEKLAAKGMVRLTPAEIAQMVASFSNGEISAK